MNMKHTINELYRLFHLLNQNFFNNELPEVQLTVYQTAKKNAYGWFTPYDAWLDENGENAKHEIALSAEYLNSKASYDGSETGYYKIVETLLHEMIHLYCHVNDIKDTSRQGRYHNKKFKQACEEHGLYFEIEKPDSSIGWSQALLTENSQKLIQDWNVDEDAFKLGRIKDNNKVAQKQSQVKYECPSCDNKARAKRDTRLMCGYCEEVMEEQE